MEVKILNEAYDTHVNSVQSESEATDSYHLVWEDDFNGKKLNVDDWNFEYHEPGWVNAELQEYVDSEKNIYVMDGCLHIQAIKEVIDGKVFYTSGRINTQGKHDFQYGRFEARAKVPDGKGFLPAFWMMPTDEGRYGDWSKCGEVDIMEIHGNALSTSYGTLHFGEPHTQKQGSCRLPEGQPDFGGGFHVFACEWEPDEFRFYVDGVLFYTVNDWFTKRDGLEKEPYPAPFNQPFYLILNLAVGGEWVGYPDEDTVFGENAQFIIDYVKVYQKDYLKNGSEVFTVSHPDNYTYLYFPIAGEQGIKSSVTPDFGGDCKLDQNTFLTEPVSSENLHNNKSTRNFWCNVEGKGAWSATGASAETEYAKFIGELDECSMKAGFMWQTVTRSSRKYGLKAEVTSFVPVNHNVEIMHVVLKNISGQTQDITPITAIPVYGRSADNLRDHRHVTSLLHRIHVSEYGVEVKPTLSFDERGHRKNDVTYFVYGVSGSGRAPEFFFPIVEEFIGEGGSLIAPEALRSGKGKMETGAYIEGKEALGGLQFSRITLEPMEQAGYTVIMGASKKMTDVSEMIQVFDSDEKTGKALRETQKYWQEKVNVSFRTGSRKEDSYLRWICFQPILRRIYGCSFLPHHDYGKGGRGWRDLWQDCLSLLFMNPDGVRQMIVDNFGGVRMDGTNATIIGSRQGEFIADRNSITRVWMDHGFWPFLTVKLYIDQTGDIGILEEQAPYFKDRQVCRGTATDSEWEDSYGMKQKAMDGVVYSGSILEHMLLEQLCAFYETGEHNHIRLRNADWNDALDMAPDNGESVAFTCAYAYSLTELETCLEKYENMTECSSVRLAEELSILLSGGQNEYDDVSWKNRTLKKYTEACMHQISGKTVEVSIKELREKLSDMAEWITEHIRRTEWVTDGEGSGWFNGYYDNHGEQVEGIRGGNVRMMLTSQVFAVMSGIADDEHIRKICRSADRYLFQEGAGGYRLNTKFDEDKFDLGRMFGFAYGEKENGGAFSHMTVMYANALYKRGFVKEGYKALRTLLSASMDFETSKIYPGIPEYFDASGRGMYHYLTGAASWYMLTMITEVYGVKGDTGNLIMEPKLEAEQFDGSGNAVIKLNFLKKTFRIRYRNPRRLPYGEYKIVKAVCDGQKELEHGTYSVCLPQNEIEKMGGFTHYILIELG